MSTAGRHRAVRERSRDRADGRGPGRPDWARWATVLDSAEEPGFASLHRSDHLTGIDGDADWPTLALWPSLTMAALRAERLRFGPLVSPMTFLPPALVATMAMDLDTLSDGRLDLGLGAGWNDHEHAMFGLP